MYAGRFARIDQFSLPLLNVQNARHQGAIRKGAIFLYMAYAVLNIISF